MYRQDRKKTREILNENELKFYLLKTMIKLVRARGRKRDRQTLNVFHIMNAKMYPPRKLNITHAKMSITFKYFNEAIIFR